MSPKQKQRISPSPLILTIILLTACSKQPTAASVTCPVAVHPSPSVKAWLKSKEPYPDDVRQYFKQIGDEQAAIEEVCPL